MGKAPVTCSFGIFVPAGTLLAANVLAKKRWSISFYIRAKNRAVIARRIVVNGRVNFDHVDGSASPGTFKKLGRCATSRAQTTVVA
jgi:hypothetical protein